MDNSADFSSFYEKATAAVIKSTQTVIKIGKEDVDFHRTSSAEFAENLDEQSSRLLSLTSSLLKVATGGTDIEPPVLEDEDAIEDNWRGIVDVIDNLLEKADACLDEFTGIIKKLSPPQQDQIREASTRQQEKKFPTIYDYGPSKIPKPQLQFRTAPNNHDTSPFRPLLKSKPHAIVPLEQSLRLVEAEKKPAFYPNPYEKEIRDAKFPESAYVAAPPVDFGPVESTEAVWVDTPEGVAEMVKELKKANEIAVDLEHHDMHTYYGLVSLMQISTRDKDWVVDTLQPWREDLQQLNEVFADPNILKVFHGSTMDIVWLQRDLGLYVVGLFDTYHAAVALGFPKRSLKFLLEKYARYEADKKYQMADWRLRPLTEEMLRYARADTHYLLYIYDCLRNELLEKSTPKRNQIDYVLERSKTEALQRYERPVYDMAGGQGAGGWHDLLSRNPALLSKEQFAVFRAVHEWRDRVAREEDEGLQCVFPRHMLFKVAIAMPVDKHTLFKTLSPVTLIVKYRINELLALIKKAKIEGATGPELRDIIKPRKTVEEAVVSATKPSPLVTGEPTVISVVRADSSQFWGAALQPQESAIVPPNYKVAASFEALRLSVPIPPMPVTVSEVRQMIQDTTPAVTPVEQSPMNTPSANKAEKRSDIFTIKEVAPRHKRKAAEVVEDSDETSSSSGSSESESESGSKSSSEEEKEKEEEEEEEEEIHIQPPTKKSRKEKKPQKKPPTVEEDTIPFDYNTASSVLHSEDMAAAAAAAIAPNHQKYYNPYAKALNAPSGVRKQKKETSGRTFTFR
ncbi:exosome nuclease subunit [Talaromyces marneffei ATCC 18224]|uniref:Exosome complex exonuclease Rrp6, putative n=1 Tax=Talaromyces marneffei (strain ATCC 18224 / CBS 334.59 / QM 7333) TaxID=441960 RepID=B6Q7H5_TALMQ|nr:exosome complex exonuclease Rrp6, putative [Talaromyces marneffei ATCC 18224]